MKAAILNAGEAAWVFEEHAARLSRAFDLEVTSEPADFNYVLAWHVERPLPGQSFVPFDAIMAASDKRTLAHIFEKHDVATPRTVLLDTAEEVQWVLENERHHQWVLKWPTGCGATGHRMQELGASIPDDWPRPYVLQQFVNSVVPEVYRLYAVGGETFGWNARRFPDGSKSSPFVAHAQGARYELEGEPPPEALVQARRALEATNLLDSFGCADLMKDEDGSWLVLEVNTDGIFSHVDRDIDVGNISTILDKKLARAFHSWVRRS